MQPVELAGVDAEGPHGLALAAMPTLLPPRTPGREAPRDVGRQACGLAVAVVVPRAGAGDVRGAHDAPGGLACSRISAGVRSAYGRPGPSQTKHGRSPRQVTPQQARRVTTTAR